MKLETLDVRELNSLEHRGISGGIFLAAFTVFSGVCLLAAGAGYIYGKLTCDAKEEPKDCSENED